MFAKSAARLEETTARCPRVSVFGAQGRTSVPEQFEQVQTASRLPCAEHHRPGQQQRRTDTLPSTVAPAPQPGGPLPFKSDLQKATLRSRESALG